MIKRRPACRMPRCDVQIAPETTYCAGHIYLNAVELRKSEEFVKASVEQLARWKSRVAQSEGKSNG